VRSRAASSSAMAMRASSMSSYAAGAAARRLILPGCVRGGDRPATGMRLCALPRLAA
jgi:hypothetical protein